MKLLSDKCLPPNEQPKAHGKAVLKHIKEDRLPPGVHQWPEPTYATAPSLAPQHQLTTQESDAYQALQQQVDHLAQVQHAQWLEDQVGAASSVAAPLNPQAIQPPHPTQEQQAQWPGSQGGAASSVAGPPDPQVIHAPYNSHFDDEEDASLMDEDELDWPLSPQGGGEESGSD